MMEFVSWDDDIPNIWKNKMFQTTNQFWLKKQPFKTNNETQKERERGKFQLLHRAIFQRKIGLQRC